MAIATGLMMAVTIAGAILAVMVRNVLHAVFGFAICLLGVAGLFFLLNAPFVATMEVLIYVGGISVAMIFVVMLSSVVGHEADESNKRRGLAALVVLPLFVGLAVVITSTQFADTPVAARVNSPEGIGIALLNQYNLAFETLSVILLIAIIGAIVIVRRDADEKLADETLSDGMLSDDKLSDDKPADDKPAEDKPADDKLTDDKLTDEKPAEDKEGQA